MQVLPYVQLRPYMAHPCAINTLSADLADDNTRVERASFYSFNRQLDILSLCRRFRGAAYWKQ